jgi:hypothetical protein
MGWDYWQYRAQPKRFMDEVKMVRAAQLTAQQMNQRPAK